MNFTSNSNIKSSSFYYPRIFVPLTANIHNISPLYLVLQLHLPPSWEDLKLASMLTNLNISRNGAARRPVSVPAPELGDGYLVLVVVSILLT